MSNNLIDKVRKYCENLIGTGRCSTFPFHDLSHTQEVVENVINIARGLGLTFNEMEPVTIAAWFHDTGYMETYNGHEEVSSILARDFLEGSDVSGELIDSVVSAITATRFGYEPVSTKDKIIKDADTFHLSKPNYMEYLDRLRKEWKELLGINYTDVEWIKSNIRFLQNHKYYTAYGKSKLEEGKINNLKRLRKQSV